jgi:catechol 2,3-dioxygenase-like lactoylglutathione lyase family enzyme
MTPVFHLAINVTDLDTARRFYGGVLGCREGRSTATWVDFDFFGHQLSLHLGTPLATQDTGRVGDHLVPMPHFGLAMLLPQWQALAARLRAAGRGPGTAGALHVCWRQAHGPCVTPCREGDGLGTWQRRRVSRRVDALAAAEAQPGPDRRRRRRRLMSIRATHSPVARRPRQPVSSGAHGSSRRCSSP